MELDKIKNLITSLDLFEKGGWEITYGLSKLNDGSRHDDLIARTEFTKTYPGEMKYNIIVNRMKLDKKKSLTSLPEISKGKAADYTNFYMVIGKEFFGDKLVSSVREDVIAENPYLESLKLVMDTITKFEIGAKRLISGKNVKFYSKKLKDLK